MAHAKRRRLPQSTFSKIHHTGDVSYILVILGIGRCIRSLVLMREASRPSGLDDDRDKITLA